MKDECTECAGRVGDLEFGELLRHLVCVAGRGAKAMTEKELEAILANNPEVKAPGYERREPLTPAAKEWLEEDKATNALVAEFRFQWRALGGPELKSEWRFDTRRRWCLDFAHPETMVAIEIHGGVFTQGRHVRGAGFLGDREKVNAAAARGWTVFEIGTGQITPDNVEMVIRAIEERQNA